MTFWTTFLLLDVFFATFAKFFCKLSRYLQIGIPDNFFGNCSSITIFLGEIGNSLIWIKVVQFFQLRFNAASLQIDILNNFFEKRCSIRHFFKFLQIVVSYTFFWQIVVEDNFFQMFFSRFFCRLFFRINYFVKLHWFEKEGNILRTERKRRKRIGEIEISLVEEKY